MECTQRLLECTQELYPRQSEKSCPDQIGFLGICGTKYPVKMGPNKIGRDPQTCNIVLNLNSISRQHAVINVLNKSEYMLMDLDSANKTKLVDKTLQPYIPHPLNNGDTLQFGDVFGIFRLLEEDNELPMTQVLDIPDTPVCTRHLSKVNNVPITTIPESPDVSDRDDSFIAASQPKGKSHFKSANDNFIKPSGKTLAIQPIGTNKIDNIYWNSSKKSTSFDLHLDDTNSNNNSLNATSSKSDNTLIDQNVGNIHEMETQVPYTNGRIESIESIYTANTQIPNEYLISPSIHNCDTQLPLLTTENLPEVQKINNQQEMQIDLFTTSKEDDNSIFNAETQLITTEEDQIVLVESNPVAKDKVTPTNELNESDEEILFDEIDGQNFEDNFESQPLLPLELSIDIKSKESVSPASSHKVNKEKSTSQVIKRDVRINSDSSTDCEDIDILPSQRILEQEDNDLTDCEDDLFEEKTANVSTLGKIPIKDNTEEHECFEDMPTQIIEEEKIEKKCCKELDDDLKKKTDDDVHENFENLQTQVINEDKTDCFADALTQPIYSEEIVSPFKIPSLIIKKKVISKLANNNKPLVTAGCKSNVIDDDDVDKYYSATQEIYEDLCSQKELSPEMVPVKTINNNILENAPLLNPNDKLVASALENNRVQCLANELSPNKSFILAEKSSGSSDNEEKIDKYVSSLSIQQVRDVVGAQADKLISDPSDVESTPKKVRPFKLMETDLPNSQEIKTSVSFNSKTLVTESSSESENENNSEEQCTPILFRKKKVPKVEAKIDLTKKFDIDTLPTRIITRLRKPTYKIQNSDEETKKTSKNIFRPKFLTEQEDNIDDDIISENISRLRSKNERTKSNKKSDNDNRKSDGDKCESSSSNKTKNNDPQKPQKSNDSKRKPTKETRKKDSRTKNKESKYRSSDEVSIDKSNNSKTNKETELYLSEEHTDKKGRSTRSLRGKKTDNKSKNDKKSGSPEKHTTKKVAQADTNTYQSKNVSSPEKEREVRRSKRQKLSKEKIANEVINKLEQPRSTMKTNNLKHEQSTVYNISSESGTDSPKRLKRSATGDVEVPNSKRKRSGANSNCTSLRSTPARTMKIQRVLFTAFPNPNDQIRMKLEKLGSVVVTDVTACTVLVTLQIKRTFKLLCAVGLGRPIVGPDWVQACADTNMVVDPWLYLIKDEAAEKRFQFSLERTLTGKRNFLKGYNVSSTPNVSPSALEMKLIVECSGGTWKESGPRWICVSCSADKSSWPSLKRRGAIIVSTEFILGGVLKQQLDVEGNKLG